MARPINRRYGEEKGNDPARRLSIGQTISLEEYKEINPSGQPLTDRPQRSHLGDGAVDTGNTARDRRDNRIDYNPGSGVHLRGTGASGRVRSPGLST